MSLGGDPFALVSSDHHWRQQTSTHTQLPSDGPKHYKSVEPSTVLPIPSPTDIDIDQDDLDFDGAVMATSKYGRDGKGSDEQLADHIDATCSHFLSSHGDGLQPYPLRSGAPADAGQRQPHRQRLGRRTTPTGAPDFDERLEGLDNSVGAGGTARHEVWRLLRRSSPSEDAIGPNFGTSSDYDARLRLRLRLRHEEYERNLTPQRPRTLSHHALATRWGPSVLRALGLDAFCVGLHALKA
ncbi:hypothetical protein GGG16DRAFT_115694 [Schizophyllum commune]